MRTVRWTEFAMCIALMLTVATGCRNNRPAPSQTIALPSGGSVVVTGVGRVYFATEKTWALAASYVTQIPLSDQSALKAQATEFLGAWKSDLDKSGVTYGAITASEPPRGIIFKTSHGKNFVAKKGPDGTWTMM